MNYPSEQVPEVLPALSTSRVLTMEFVEGANVCDVAALRRLGVRPQDVAKLVAQTFNEMIFTFGDVRLARCCPVFLMPASGYV